LFDVGHSLKDQKSKPQKRSSPLRGAAWEIHPVMKLEIAE